MTSRVNNVQREYGKKIILFFFLWFNTSTMYIHCTSFDSYHFLQPTLRVCWIPKLQNVLLEMKKEMKSQMWKFAMSKWQHHWLVVSTESVCPMPTMGYWKWPTRKLLEQLKCVGRTKRTKWSSVVCSFLSWKTQKRAFNCQMCIAKILHIKKLNQFCWTKEVFRFCVFHTFHTLCTRYIHIWLFQIWYVLFCFYITFCLRPAAHIVCLSACRPWYLSEVTTRQDAYFIFVYVLCIAVIAPAETNKEETGQ